MDINNKYKINKNGYSTTVSTVCNNGKYYNCFVLYINSLMVAIFLCGNYIAIIFNSLGIISEGVLPIIIVATLIIAYFITTIISPEHIRINRKALALLLFILLFFVVSLVIKGFDSTVNKYLIEFLAYGFVSFLLTLLPLKPYKILYYTMLIGILYLINPLEFIKSISLSKTMYSGISMGASYAILPCVAAAIIHFAFFRKNNWLSILGYLANIILLVILLKQGSRGAVLSIFVLIFLIFYIKITKNFRSNYFIIKLFFLSITMILSLIILLNIESILLWSYKIFQEIGIEIATLIKSYYLINSYGLIGILNFREEIYKNSFTLFLESPLWGQGIGIYGDIYGWYPHNLFLQLLCEGGLLLTLPITFILIKTIDLLLRPWSKDNVVDEWRYMLMLLLVVAIPRLLFSSYLWQQQSFWLFIFLYFVTWNRYKTSHHVMKM